MNYYQDIVLPIVSKLKSNDRVLLLMPPAVTGQCFMSAVPVTVGALKSAVVAATFLKKIPIDCYWNATILDGTPILSPDIVFAGEIWGQLEDYKNQLGHFF